VALPVQWTFPSANRLCFKLYRLLDAWIDRHTETVRHTDRSRLLLCVIELDGTCVLKARETLSKSRAGLYLSRMTDTL